MNVIQNKIFENLVDENTNQVISNITFLNCKFDNCILSSTLSIDNRTIVRNIYIKNCEQKNCIIDAAILERVTIENLKTRGLLQTWGAVFNEVILKGKIDKIMISPLLKTATAPQYIQEKFNKKKQNFYRKINWALDISEADFIECEIRGIPADLIKRDPESQVVITREKAKRIDWSDIYLEDTYYQTAIQLFLERGEYDYILIAPKRSKDFKHLKMQLDLLVHKGIAIR